MNRSISVIARFVPEFPLFIAPLATPAEPSSFLKPLSGTCEPDCSSRPSHEARGLPREALQCGSCPGAIGACTAQGPHQQLFEILSATEADLGGSTQSRVPYVGTRTGFSRRNSSHLCAQNPEGSISTDAVLSGVLPQRR